MTARPASLVFIIVTLIIDMLGIGIVLPIMPRLIESFTGGDVVEAAHFVGLQIALYSVMQFLFGPLTGSLSDRFGRRPVLLASLFGLGATYILSAFAPSLAWFIALRTVAGVMASTFAVANAYIADIAPPEKRAEYFGLVGFAFGIGFIAGPVLGGILGQIDLRLPFLAAGILSFANVVFGFIVLPETLKPEHRRKVDLARANPIGAIPVFAHARGGMVLIGGYVLAALAQRGLENIWALYTGYRYSWSALEVGLSLAAVGFLFAVSQGFVVRLVVPRLGERRALLTGLAISAFGSLLYGLASEGWMAYAIMLIHIPGWALVTPSLQALLTRATPPNEQGLLQGALASVNTGTAIVGPPVATAVFAYHIGPEAPMLLPGASFLLGALLLLASIAVIAAGGSFAPRRQVAD
ncbi:MAG: TCR/Tet family MFS transporter [Alphaproteobacteria bacterium]|nr:TCR/Tet family MFS transporter [Alphaproteobacteria bacterium]